MALACSCPDSVGMVEPPTTGVGRLRSNMLKWGVPSFATCESCLKNKLHITCCLDVRFIVLPVGHVACESQTARPLAAYFKQAQAFSLVSPSQLGVIKG